MNCRFLMQLGAMAVSIMILSIMASCSRAPKGSLRPLEPTDVLWVEVDEPLRFNQRMGMNTFCNDWQGYVPDPEQIALMPPRTVRVVFHYMYDSLGRYNFPEDQTQRFTEALLDTINSMMFHNNQLNLPEGNDIPALSTRIRYELAHHPDLPAISHHRDQDLFFMVTRGPDRNNTDRAVIQKYAIVDSLIHVFVMPHHPDSIASPTYAPYGSGIALSNSVKICGVFENNTPPHGAMGLLAHEFGHVLGLSHAWTGFDGCEDTEKHSNRCFSQTGIPPCDGVISNNLMDYNRFQNAISPCQIARMHANLSRANSMQRSLLVRDWCQAKEGGDVFIKDAQHWTGSKDLQGNVIIQNGASLTIDCRVSFPQGGKLIVEPGGQLFLRNALLHQDCGLPWDGILFREIPGKTKGLVQAHGQSRIENAETVLSVLAD